MHHECEFSQHSTDDSLVDFNNVMDPVISKRLNHQKLEVIINIKILNPDMHFIKTKSISFTKTKKVYIRKSSLMKEFIFVTSTFL